MKLVTPCLGILLLAMPLAARARADVIIGFDDITTTVATVPNGYSGLNWSSFLAVNTLFFPGLDWGVQAGLVSPYSDVTNASANPATVSSASPFVLESAYLTGLWNDGLNIKIEGSLNGNAVFSVIETVDATAPTFIALPFLTVDTVVFSSSGGTHHAAYTNGFGENFVMDDMTVRLAASVPEPSTLWLLGVATIVVGMAKETAGRIEGLK